MKKADWTRAVRPGDLVRVVAGGAMCWDVLDVARAQDARVRGGTPGLVLDSSMRARYGIAADYARVLVTDVGLSGIAVNCVRVLFTGLGLRWIRLGNLRSTT